MPTNKRERPPIFLDEAEKILSTELIHTPQRKLWGLLFKALDIIITLLRELIALERARKKNT
jgi:hypothetical protein